MSGVEMPVQGPKALKSRGMCRRAHIVRLGGLVKQVFYIEEHASTWPYMKTYCKIEGPMTETSPPKATALLRPRFPSCARRPSWFRPCTTWDHVWDLQTPTAIAHM